MNSHEENCRSDVFHFSHMVVPFKSLSVVLMLNYIFQLNAKIQLFFLFLSFSIFPESFSLKVKTRF